MADQLPSWADGQAKARILEFVRSVTEPLLAGGNADGDACPRRCWRVYPFG